MTKSGFDLDEIERLRERLGSVSSAMMEGDNLAILLCGYFDNPDQDGSDDDCGWTPDALTGYTQVCDAIHAHYAPTLTAMIAAIRELRATVATLGDSARAGANVLDAKDAEIRELRAENARLRMANRSLRRGLYGLTDSGDADEIATTLEAGGVVDWDKYPPNARAALGEPQ